MSANPVDDVELRRLEAHLIRLLPQAERDAIAAVRRGAVNIKNDWKANARASAPKHAPQYPNAIGFDVHRAGPVTIADIGPDKAGPQGALGNLLEYGSARNPPHRDGGRALDAETPRFEAQMALIVGRGLAWL
ncbi:hypothetical protein [Actinacidiphila sp. ITFR-21]|uniref:hypothetical protein n=1 Tax=Actinacidiphila sp. ITFR-21 TaxID=3075199 RepID=UPI00288B3321|nr:hypothetical protein [Streptomyces sp. ITFR-21]WNI16911.1 hypothetical protein RLT57_16205 [Streptomyces sp. ITFR-21]